MPADAVTPSGSIFLPMFQKLVPAHLETPWTVEDGMDPAELDELLASSPAARSTTGSLNGTEGAHRIAGVPMPLALYEFHLALGNCPDLLETDHFFWDADELEVLDGFLLFLEDAAESTVWGLRVSDAALPDPLVWRRSTGADAAEGDWNCEGGTFSEFTTDLLAWTFEEDGDDADGDGLGVGL